MTDKEFISTIALLRNRSVSDIEVEIKMLLGLGLADIYSLVPGFWTKTSETFTLGSTGTSAYLVDLKDEFEDFKTLRMLWTNDGPIEFLQEKEFHRRYANPANGDPGTPGFYFFRERSVIELYPRTSEGLTVYISYRYKPGLESIEDLPSEWHYLPLYYVMGLFEGEDSNFYKGKYEQGLIRIQNFAKESEEEFSKILSDGQDEIIYSSMEIDR